MRIDPVVCMRSTIFETINKLYGGWESAEIPKTSPTMSPIEIVAPTESPRASNGQIQVTNGIETLYLDAADEAEAAKDGFRRVG
jgi:hypothetical protein